jgi:hypothetical protein
VANPPNPFALAHRTAGLCQALKFCVGLVRQHVRFQSTPAPVPLPLFGRGAPFIAWVPGGIICLSARGPNRK